MWSQDYTSLTSANDGDSLSHITCPPEDTRHGRLPSITETLGEVPRRPVPIPILPKLPALQVPGTTLPTYNGKPTASYRLFGRLYVMERPDNEGKVEFVRQTVGGRQLRYILDIIQEPKKARACGNGPRSSADRRPVDPPPVIVLNIKDHHTNEDITMSYDASFLLYASLEVARPIAHGRMAPAPQAPPVLSGVCVASAAYLDRPTKAGYFIFPDLSVRHEGWYRLKFSLFEQVKHPGDADLDRPFINDENSQEPLLHEAMSNRMEVVSHPFQVFSAKKFPGLDQSTGVSKVLADQGCRVRIRREIRQRKRTVEEKPEPRHETPDSWHLPGHSRSASRNSMDGPYAPNGALRRTSMESIYQRRPSMPSRAPSIASMTHPSPTTPSAPYIPSMPPPMHRGYEQPPQASTYQPRYPNYYPPSSPARTVALEPSMRLPPINTHSATTPPPQRSYYNLPEPSSTKRASSRTYNDDYSMKLGARPDHPSRGEPITPSGFIEADNGDDDEGERSQVYYPRANGNRGLKVHQLLS